ncbi:MULTISPECIES: LysR substrate-binding domain-containing protein [unclassified Microbacterium]|uniref:LysR substrate-binding domain-containing protein n=1 Tax=unclassified Microbacterium TaxID=2609290 RepID=UPI00214BF4EE|nr:MULTISPECIES: LysR substrate-binding domain-containing protein [unclassified Microbacterium]MCR2811318.1 LysR substrate-binding domain-containing protein [Microbacterium sp. zg.B185]WIM19475.1 LysR substrate-binding domain-containing protein [Microbacterium sp. zg-B185]
MEVHKARAFLAVAEELHFGRAAARLHIAQPPLSRMIRKLEDELGAALFERNPRRVALTAVGEALVAPARELVMQSERMAEVVRAAQHGETGRVRVGFAGASVNSVVSALARRIRAELPNVTLELYGSQLSHPGLERLRAGTLDAVIGRWDYLPKEVRSRVLAEEELLVALPDDHRLAHLLTISATEISNEPWIVLPGGSGATLSNRLYMLGMRARFVPRVVQTAVDSATQLLLVDAGMGIALTFSGVRENVPAHAVVFRPVLPDLGSVDVRLAWRASDQNPALAAVVEVSRLLDHGVYGSS